MLPSYWLEIIVLLGGLVLLLLEAFLLFKVFVLVSGILTLILALDYRKVLSKFTANPDSEDGTGEYYCLFLFATAGMMWMASAKDLVSLFVALELTTITSYILVGYMRRNVGSLEAGVKFLILGSLSTGFLVYGISWIYGATATTDLALMGDKITEANSTYLLFGLSLVLISLAFKVGAVPMHLWIPDVYQGAPTPTTAFLSIASKASGFVIAIRVLEPFLTADSLIRDQLLEQPFSSVTSPPFRKPTSNASSPTLPLRTRASSFFPSPLGMLAVTSAQKKSSLSTWSSTSS